MRTWVSLSVLVLLCGVFLGPAYAVCIDGPDGPDGGPDCEGGPVDVGEPSV